MTANKEDYLKAIYHCGGAEGRVSTKAVAQKLGIASASVTEMLARLGREGLLQYEPYKGTQLTPAGLDACVAVVRSHELWEVFLVQCLGYRLSEAHSDAEALEHATSPLLAERLDEFLQRPDFCPHGAAIPRPGALPPARDMAPLSSLPAGASALVAQVEEEAELLDYLEALGLKVGVSVTVERYGAYEGAVELTADGRAVQVSRKAAGRVWVLPEEA